MPAVQTLAQLSVPHQGRLLSHVAIDELELMRVVPPRQRPSRATVPQPSAHDLRHVAVEVCAWVGHAHGASAGRAQVVRGACTGRARGVRTRHARGACAEGRAARGACVRAACARGVRAWRARGACACNVRAGHARVACAWGVRVGRARKACAQGVREGRVQGPSAGHAPSYICAVPWRRSCAKESRSSFVNTSVMLVTTPSPSPSPKGTRREPASTATSCPTV